MTKVTIKNLIVTSFVAVLVILNTGTVLAQSCDNDYGSDDKCENTIRIVKNVRIKGNSDWKDKVIDVDSDETVEFRVKITNTGDVELDNMKMTDFLPDEMYKIGGSGLTEEFDNFEPGETKEFIIEAKIEATEFDRANFEKCIVNKAEARQDGRFRGADTATVCYGNVILTELPETGAETWLGALGLGFTALGIFIKKSARLA